MKLGCKLRRTSLAAASHLRHTSARKSFPDGDDSLKVAVSELP